MGGNKKKKSICRECSKAKFPAISAAKLGHEACLVTAYRVLGVFNERDGYGATPIHYAARNGQLDCLQWLVTHSGISPVVAAKNGTTAAHDSAALGHLQCLQYLLEKTKCSAQDRTNEGATILHMACRFGHVSVTRWLIEKGLSSPSEKGDNGVTPVHLCAAKNHLECLKYLTRSSKYLPNELTVHGATPVYFAAQEGSLECLQWLMEHGEGDPTIFANDGMGPLHAAAQAGELESLKWLVRHGGVKPSQKAEDGATAMHFAAAGGQMLCLKWLVDNGGSLMDRDDLGGTPLHDAAEQGQTEVVSFILGCGVQKDIPDNDGYTPIDLAKDNNHLDCMKLFYIKSPNLLNSLAPQHPQNRASASDDEMLRKEQQRRFEMTLLSNTTQKEREEMWKKAKENVPTSKQLHKVTEDSVDNTDSGGGGSRSKNRNSLDAHRLSLSLVADLIDDHASKDRPALSPDLFTHPHEEKEEDKSTHTTTEKEKLNENKEAVEHVVVEVERGPIVATTGTVPAGQQYDHSDDDDDEKFDSGSSSNIVDDKQVNVAARNSCFEDNDIEEMTKSTHDLNPYDDFVPLQTTELQPTQKQPTTTTTPSASTTNATTTTDAEIPSTNLKTASKKPSRLKGFFKRFGTKKPKAVNPSTAAVADKATPINNSTTTPTDNSQPHSHTKALSSDKQDANQVVLRHKPPKPTDQVFTRRTSKEEERVTITHNRLSTDDDEVAIKFEKLPLAVRRSNLSSADNMSSPESSDDELRHDEEEDEDIFRPISKTGFDKFGKPIGIENPDDEAVLETRGSLASLDTMFVNEDEVQSSDVVGVGGRQSTKQLDDQNNAVSDTNVFNRQPIAAAAATTVKNVYNEPLVKSSPPSARRNDSRRPLLVASIEEEEEEEVEDSLSPLPSISNSPSMEMVENRFKIDGRKSPRMKRNENTRVITRPNDGSQASSTAAVQSSVKTSGVRSFALVKQMYDESNKKTAAASGYSRSGKGRMNAPAVYSPLMVVATASPRVSLSSLQEEKDSELESDNVPQVDTEHNEKQQPDDDDDGNDEAGNHKEDSKETTRISLTPSQEAAFDNLEKLKDSLDISSDKQQKQPDPETHDKEALRTSPAVEELFDMIKGLDDMIKSKKNSCDGSSSEYSLSDGSNSEIHSLVSTPRQPGKNHTGEKIKELVTVNVEVDGVGMVQVKLKKDALVISLIFKVASATELPLTANHALFEVHNSLRIERPLEDHERIDEIMTRWPKKNPPHFHLHTYHEKYLLWENNPLPKGYVGQFLKLGKVPNISSILHYCKGGGGGKVKWFKDTYCLGSLGVYLIGSSKATNNMDLVCATDHLLYFPIYNGSGEWTKYKSLPSKHCFVMKPGSSWREKDLKMFCCEDYQSFMQWVSGIRLVKYGLQLKCNYVAMNKRLDQSSNAAVKN